MILLRHLDKIKIIDDKIRRKITGTPNELAKELNISRSHLYNYIEIMKKRGAEISFSRKERSFLYTKSFRINNLLKDYNH